MSAATPRGVPASVPPPIIDVHTADVTFNGDLGVHDLTLSVPPATIFGLIGPSGSGKTTTVRLLTGIYRPMRGEVRVLGRVPHAFSPRTREQIGYMPQFFTLYPNLTVLENLNFVASLYGLGYFRRRRRLEELLELVELSDARTRLGRQLSGGMQRRLSLACALVHNPSLIFADEPTAGIDPVLRGKLWEHFRALRDQGRTLFVTTQYVGEAAFCDYVAVMREGRVIQLDTPEGLRKRALGGEIIRLAVDPAHELAAAQLLIQQPFINDVHRHRGHDGLLFLYVDEASEALPRIFAVLRGRPEIVVRTAEEYLPPFDDVFVALMEQDEAAERATTRPLPALEEREASHGR
ncbi:MAG TPA: ABC transporter ATP-binding protein [Roseiflexaceae bacterium]|nr:ABC transporter ATP-binding protein [Roseiflexaceae bacterium]